MQCHDQNDGENKYLRAFKYGLPKCKSSCCKDIIIIGAGVSGLTAAQMLKHAGHRVKILEASSRVGGRIQTYR